MLRDDPNESSAVYLLTSDDEYAVCGTNFLPNQLLCRKYLATKFFFVEETFDHVPGNEKDQVSPICRYRTIPETKLGANLGHFRHRRTIGIYKRTWKQAKITERNLTTCKWIFHQLAAKNLNVNAVQRSTASVIQYSIGKKKLYYSFIWPARIGVCPR